MDRTSTCSAALLAMTFAAGCYAPRQNVPAPRPPTVSWAYPDWRGASVFVWAAPATRDLAPLVEAELTNAHFIVVGSAAEARLVVRLTEVDGFTEGGSSGPQSYLRRRRIVDAKTLYDDLEVGSAHVELTITVAQRFGESWAELQQRQELETSAADRFVAASIADEVVTGLPLRDTLKTAVRAEVAR